MNVTWSWRSWMLLLLQTLPGCPCKDRFALWAHSWVQQSSWCRFSIFVEGVPAISFHSSCLHISYHVSYHISTDLSRIRIEWIPPYGQINIGEDQPRQARSGQTSPIRILPLRLSLVATSSPLVATSSWSALIKVVSSLVGHYTADELQNRQVRRRKEYQRIRYAAYLCIA